MCVADVLSERAHVQVVCDFCAEHLDANKAAFADPRLQLVVDDARAQLENWPGTFDVIIGDLADPVYGGPCYQVSILGRAVDAGPAPKGSVTCHQAAQLGNSWQPFRCFLGHNLCHGCVLQPELRSRMHLNRLRMGVCGALQLYTQEFYEAVVKQKLNPGGIFVTQSGPAGVMSASEVGWLLPLHGAPQTLSCWTRR